jgi:hypothetical protein
MDLKRAIRSKLPHDFARQIHRAAFPKWHAETDDLLQRVPTRPGERSLKPLIDNNAIFVHIPKCGGIAIGQAVFGCVTGQHMSIHKYRLMFSKTQFDKMFKFTFVRNPWDRLVSAYHFLEAGGIGQTDSRLAENSVLRFNGFDDFVKGFIDQNSGAMPVHFIPQYRFLCYSQTDLPEVDFIGKLETVQEDFDTICRRMGIENRLNVKNRTSSRPSDYRKSYTPQTADIVARAYRRDIELFDYRFE